MGKINKILAFVFCAFFILASCYREFNNPLDPNYEGVPIIGNVTYETIEPDTIFFKGKIASTGGSNIWETGIAFSNSTLDPQPNKNEFSLGVLENGEFEGKVYGLTPRQVYFFRVYAKNDFGIGYSDPLVSAIDSNIRDNPILDSNIVDTTVIDTTVIDTTIVDTNIVDTIITYIEPCNNLSFFETTGYLEWNGISYDTISWSIASKGFLNNAIIAEHSGSSYKQGAIFLEFNNTFQRPGEIRFWVSSDGSSLFPSYSINGQQFKDADYDYYPVDQFGVYIDSAWMNFHIPIATAGNKNLKIIWDRYHTNSSRTFIKADEFEFREYD